jgi:murein DD-endopeptidase MepM/ murein hydrolase activator NlpD
MIFICPSFRHRIRPGDTGRRFGAARSAEPGIHLDPARKAKWIPAFAGMAALLLAAASSAAADKRINISADVPITLDTPLQQGQLVIAHAPPGTRIEFDGRKLRTSADGTFVFGLGRDAPPVANLTVYDSSGRKRLLPLPVEQRSYPTERVNGLPQQTVTPNPDVLARIRREQATVQAARTRDDAREDFRHGFALPVQGARISGVYGSQRIDNGIPKAPHMGLDMAVPAGTPIHAPADGIVTFAAPDLFLTGGTVLLDHGYGLDSSFLHMSQIKVKIGDHIKRGQVIGLAGMTGRATGPHVHWGFNWFNVRLDPALLPKP